MNNSTKARKHEKASPNPSEGGERSPSFGGGWGEV